MTPEQREDAARYARHLQWYCATKVEQEAAGVLMVGMLAEIARLERAVDDLGKLTDTCVKDVTGRPCSFCECPFRPTENRLANPD